MQNNSRHSFMCCTIPASSCSQWQWCRQWALMAANDRAVIWQLLDTSSVWTFKIIHNSCKSYDCSSAVFRSAVKINWLEIWLIYPLLPFHTLLGSRGCEVPLRHPSPVSPQRNNGHRKPPWVCPSSSSSMPFMKFIGSHNFAISPRED